MDLFTVFLIITGSLILLIGLLWLISWLTRSREENSVGYEVILEKNVPIPPSDEPKKTAEPAKVELKSTPEPNDLKVIEGISPKIASVLNDSGITTFTQLAATQVIILESILKEANISITDPGTWAEQAVLAGQGNWDELHKLQDELQRGRRAA